MTRKLITYLICLLAMPSVSYAWQVSVTEQEALERVDQGKYREARKLADKALEQPPGIVARYVLSLIQSEREGNLPTALFLLKAAKQQLLTVEELEQLSPLGREWHRKILLHELGVLGHLDRRSEQLALIDTYERYHKPKITERRIWPMVKLGQYNAARDLGVSLLLNERITVRQRALNGLMAVEEEAGNRQASFDWGHRALTELGSRSCVITTNTALGARRIFDFSQAIALDLKALEADLKDCPTSPHAQLAPVYLLSGDFQKSVSSLKALRGASRSRRMALQNEMLIRSRFVEILLALGAFEPAWLRMEQILERPDRSGMVSYAPGLVEFGNYILGYAVLTARLAELEEQISVRPWAQTWSLYKTKLALKVKQATMSRHLRRLAATDDHLGRAIRPYMYENMMWYTLPIAQALGGAVIEQSVTKALRTERELVEQARTMLDTFRVESLHGRADHDEVIRLGERVLKSLPEGPKLLRARITTLLAHSLWETNNEPASFAYFSDVMAAFPTTIRLLNVALPISFQVTGGAQAKSVSETLTRSPRFVMAPGSPFTLQITEEGQAVFICLTGAKRYGCTTLRSDASLEERFEALDDFHRKVFAPGIELTQSDMSTLDGRAVEGDAASVIDDLIGRPRGKK